MKKIILSFTLLVSSLFITLPAVNVRAADADVDPFQTLCQADRAGSKLCQDLKRTNSEASASRGVLGPNGIATKIVQIIVYFTGVISVIMVIIGAVKYTLSAGDSNATQSAKNTIMYALIGLVVALFSQVIVSFVLSKL